MGANFSAKILNNAVTAIQAQQQVIANISNNIANADTEGYAKRILNLETRVTSNRGTGIEIGNGVVVGSLTRKSDEFLEKVLREAISDKYSADAQSDIITRLENLFDLTGTQNTIGSALSSFFESLDGLTMDPANLELRSEVMERATDVVTAISSTYNEVAQLQMEADKRIELEVSSVNSLTSEIAKLNGLIGTAEATGHVAASERDKREELIKQLSEKMSFDVRENSDGTVDLTLADGFTIVTGTTARQLEFTTTPSFATTGVPPSLSGDRLGYIVYDYDTSGSSPAHFDLSDTLKAGGGTIGGLLKVRGTNAVTNTSAFDADGTLVEVASRVESIARELLTSFNDLYLGDTDGDGVPDDGDSTTAGFQPSAVDLDGNPVANVFGFFGFQYSGATAVDGDGDGRPSTADLNNLITNENIVSFASRMQLAVSNPREIAAAFNDDPAAPVVYSPGDGRNIENLVQMQQKQLNFSVGSFTLNNATFNDVYNETVGHVGNASARISLTQSVSDDNLLVAKERRDNFSAVNLDKEFTDLIQFQRAFQASARVIRTANDLSDLIVSII
ncbi:MAG: flagellar hook-associated protein FlgK [Candidatus Dadabacteria bacterium]|nr:MAG: flagellar hook-associated protein FlgK [Candidatus Dadabacteria bacterium]